MCGCAGCGGMRQNAYGGHEGSSLRLCGASNSAPWRSSTTRINWRSLRCRLWANSFKIKTTDGAPEDPNEHTTQHMLTAPRLTRATAAVKVFIAPRQLRDGRNLCAIYISLNPRKFILNQDGHKYSAEGNNRIILYY
jgi:hypothetical protein